MDFEEKSDELILRIPDINKSSIKYEPKPIRIFNNADKIYLDDNMVSSYLRSHDIKWEQKVVKDLNSHIELDQEEKNYILEELKNGGYTSLIPPLHYLEHYVGTAMGDERENILSKLSTYTLKTIIALINPDPKFQTSDINFLELLTNYTRATDLFTLQSLTPEQLENFLTIESPGSKTYEDYYNIIQLHNITFNGLYTVFGNKVRFIKPKETLDTFKLDHLNIKTALVPIRTGKPNLIINRFKTSKNFNFLIKLPKLDKYQNIGPNETILQAIVNRKKIPNLLYYLVYKSESVQKILEMLKWNFVGTHEEALQLIWLAYYYGVDYQDFNYIIYLSQDTIIDLILSDTVIKLPTIFTQDLYSDRVALIWTLVTWSKYPLKLINELTYYKERVSYPISIIYDIDYNLYSENKLMDPAYTPTRAVSLIKPKRIEDFLLIVKSYNIYKVLNFAGLIVKPDINITQEEYFRDNLKYYSEVFERTRLSMFEKTPLKLLNILTDSEIISGYHIIFKPWKSRLELVNNIVNQVIGLEDVWSFVVPRTNMIVDKVTPINGEINVYSLETRDYTDVENPVISYGTTKRYRTYQLEELCDAFYPREITDIEGNVTSDVLFYNPSFYNPGVNKYKRGYSSTFDPLNYFPDKSMVQLLHMIEASTLPSVKLLVETINSGFQVKSKCDQYFLDLGVEINSLKNPLDFETIYSFTLELFIMSLYARFWRGPPHQYPYIFVPEGANFVINTGVGTDRMTALPDGVNLQDYATVEERDNNYLKHSLNLMGLIDVDPGFSIDHVIIPKSQIVLNIIKKFKFVQYDWLTDSSRLSAVNILDLIIDSGRSEMCIADMSDRGLKTSYYILKRIFKVKDISIAVGKYLKLPVPQFHSKRMNITNHIEPTKVDMMYME
jgi:hypothetical protein